MTPPEAPFDEPWQAQAFALTVRLHESGVFTWTEWAAELSRQIAERPRLAYYENWVAALEALALGRGLTARGELTERKAAWERAYLTTPHGRPVTLAP